MFGRLERFWWPRGSAIGSLKAPWLVLAARPSSAKLPGAEYKKGKSSHSAKVVYCHINLKIHWEDVEPVRFSAGARINTHRPCSVMVAHVFIKKCDLSSIFWPAHSSTKAPRTYNACFKYINLPRTIRSCTATSTKFQGSNP